jgi:hypothetical protein
LKVEPIKIVDREETNATTNYRDLKLATLFHGEKVLLKNQKKPLPAQVQFH